LASSWRWPQGQKRIHRDAADVVTVAEPGQYSNLRYGIGKRDGWKDAQFAKIALWLQEGEKETVFFDL
jgi:hypothetical protein